MYETMTTIQGRLVADPVVKSGRSGEFTTFRMASSERHPDRGEPGRWVDSDPSFYQVTVYRSTGENVARCLRKGHPVVVYGKIRMRQWKREDGTYQVEPEMEAYSVGHDLRWGVTAYTRNGDLAPRLPEQADEPARGFGDPQRDAYTVERGPGQEAEVAVGADPGTSPADTVDAGPLVGTRTESAA